MPNRILKESICYSDDLDRLSAFEETVFYRLIVNCDDYGRLDARLGFLKSKLFVTKKGIMEKDIQAAVSVLTGIGLIFCYEVDNKPYLMFAKWAKHQRIRNLKEKYPPPPFGFLPQIAADFGEMSSESNTIQPVSKLESKSESEFKSEFKSQAEEAQSRGLFLGYDFSENVKGQIMRWLTYKKERNEEYKPTGLKSFLSQTQSKLNEFGEKEVFELFESCMANGWKGIIWDRLKISSYGKENKKGLTKKSRFDFEEIQKLDNDFLKQFEGDD